MRSVDRRLGPVCPHQGKGHVTECLGSILDRRRCNSGAAEVDSFDWSFKFVRSCSRFGRGRGNHSVLVQRRHACDGGLKEFASLKLIPLVHGKKF